MWLPTRYRLRYLGANYCKKGKQKYAMPVQPAYSPETLTDWARRLFEARGCAGDIAATVARILVEGDLLGHDTHGLALLGPYLRKIDQGVMKPAGEIEVVSDRPAALLWDGGGLPGPWLTVRAVEEAGRRAGELGTATVVIRHSGHIACLASYLEAPARAGLVVEILSSDPSVASVAPYGGIRPLFTPNPLAFAFPTSGDPVMIDISSSITTNGMSMRLQSRGKMFEHAWLLDNSGQPTRDPSVLETDPPGSIQLLGGMDYGHKGYGLALMVEAMTGGLAGYGRAEQPTEWGATVIVRVSDPAAFGGADNFVRQLDWLADAARADPAIDPANPVRLPGERGLARKRQALQQGLTLNPEVQAQVEELAAETGIDLPAGLQKA